VRIEWSPAALASARRFMADQGGMRAIGAAVAALAEDPSRHPDQLVSNILSKTADQGDNRRPSLHVARGGIRWAGKQIMDGRHGGSVSVGAIFHLARPSP
jgi:hypothetical protein